MSSIWQLDFSLGLPYEFAIVGYKNHVARYTLGTTRRDFVLSRHPGGAPETSSWLSLPYFYKPFIAIKVNIREQFSTTHCHWDTASKLCVQRHRPPRLHYRRAISMGRSPIAEWTQRTSKVSTSGPIWQVAMAYFVVFAVQFASA